MLPRLHRAAAPQLPKGPAHGRGRALLVRLQARPEPHLLRRPGRAPSRLHPRRRDAARGELRHRGVLRAARRRRPAARGAGPRHGPRLCAARGRAHLGHRGRGEGGAGRGPRRRDGRRRPLRRASPRAAARRRLGGPRARLLRLREGRRRAHGICRRVLQPPRAQLRHPRGRRAPEPPHRWENHPRHRDDDGRRHRPRHARALQNRPGQAGDGAAHSAGRLGFELLPLVRRRQLGHLQDADRARQARRLAPRRRGLWPRRQNPRRVFRAAHQRRLPRPAHGLDEAARAARGGRLDDARPQDVAARVARPQAHRLEPRRVRFVCRKTHLYARLPGAGGGGFCQSAGAEPDQTPGHGGVDAGRPARRGDDAAPRRVGKVQKVRRTSRGHARQQGPRGHDHPRNS
mmetsp:Transcript_18079/g.60998  ORF Transcript_18079/g.60998 Transcript_18079/m.60998 type:complete len:402 (-) Transcript_18079:292-1497(-)